MSAAFEDATQELAKWDAYIAADEAAERVALKELEAVRARLDHAVRAADVIRRALREAYEKQARHEPPNAK